MPMQQDIINGAEQQMARLAPGDRQGIEKVLDGLIAVLAQERAALEDTTNTQFGELTRQKLQLLMQLNRAAQMPASAMMPAPLEEKLKLARRMLDENAAMLKRRMDAIREISALISKEIRDVESDGTYSVAGAYGRV